jgi:hypothetical protein
MFFIVASYSTAQVLTDFFIACTSVAIRVGSEQHSKPGSSINPVSN